MSNALFFLRNNLAFLLIAMVLVHMAACKKKDSPQSAVALINSFKFTKADNPILPNDIVGVRSRDTFYVSIPSGITERSFIPTILFEGKSISPASGVRQDFTNIVTYTITAANGNTKPFYVVIKTLSSEKRITRYVFEKAKNPSLTEDLVGIINGSAIEIVLPSASVTGSLVPTIDYTGASLLPQATVPVNLTGIPTYTVTAEDGSYVNYSVLSSFNARIYVGSEDGYLYELNARTGTLIRKWNLGAPVQSNPMFYNGYLFACSGNGILYCIDTATAAVKWTHQMDAMTGTNGAPIGYNGAIFYNDFASVNINTQGGVYSVDAATGARRWKVIKEFANSLILVNGIVYSAQRFYDMDAYDWNTGASLWGNAGAPIGFTCNPLYWNNMIFGDAELVDLAAIDLGAPLVWKWRHMLGVLGGTALAPTMYNDKLYSDNGPNINCLNPLTGEVIWKYSVSFSGFRPPVGMNGKVYANTKGGELYAINADNGTLAWKYGSLENSNPSLGNVTAANDMVYFGNWNNTITALNANTGATQWVFFGTQPFYGGILIIDNAGNQFHSSFSGNKQ